MCKNDWESVASDINNLLVLLKDGTCDYFVASFCFWSEITPPTSRSIFLPDVRESKYCQMNESSVSKYTRDDLSTFQPLYSLGRL